MAVLMIVVAFIFIIVIAIIIFLSINPFFIPVRSLSFADELRFVSL